MINLLPPETKQTFMFARRNAFLVRYLSGLLIGVAALAISVVIGLVLLQQETNNYKDSIAAAEADLKAQREEETIARVKDISNSLKLVVDVLEQEVLFSKLLRQVGAIMPSGTVLQSLSLDSELSGALDLQAGAVNYNAASQVQINLSDPDNGIFTKADLVSITCGASQETGAYPCLVTLRAEFGQDNQFMLLSAQGTSR